MSDEEINNDTPTTETSFVPYDTYWLEKARTLIDNSVTLYTNRIKNLNNFLTYLAGGTFFGAVSYATYIKSTDLGVYILVAIPLVFITFAKLVVGVQATEPVMSDTNMRSPGHINESYAAILKKLSKQVRKAAVAVAMATGVTLLCLPFAVYRHNVISEAQLEDTFVSIQNVGEVVQVRGLLPNSENVSVTLFGKGIKGDNKDKDIPPYMTTVVPTEACKIMADYRLKDLGMKLDRVELSYKISGKQHMYTYQGAATTKPKPPKKEETREEQKNDSLTAPAQPNS